MPLFYHLHRMWFGAVIHEPNWTWNNKIWKISHRTGPGPTKFRKSRTKSDRSALGSGGPWIPGLGFGRIKLVRVKFNPSSN